MMMEIRCDVLLLCYNPQVLLFVDATYNIMFMFTCYNERFYKDVHVPRAKGQYSAIPAHFSPNLLLFALRPFRFSVIFVCVKIIRHGGSDGRDVD